MCIKAGSGINILYLLTGPIANSLRDGSGVTELWSVVPDLLEAGYLRFGETV